jgi:hypothetical protein
MINKNKRAQMAADFKGQIIVIMPVRNEGDWAVRTVRNLLASKARGTDLHFCIIDDGSADGCCKIFKRGKPKDITLFESKQGGNGQGVARSLGVYLFPHARAYYSIDAHETMETKHGIEQLVLDAEETGGIVMARSLNLSKEKLNVGVGCKWGAISEGGVTRPQGLWIREPKTPTRLTPVNVLAGADYAFTRKTFDALGGFGESYGYYGYFDLDLSINARFLNIPVHCNTQVSAGHLYRGPRPYTMSGRWRWWGFVECLRQRFRPDIWRKHFLPSAQLIQKKLQDPMIDYLIHTPRLDILQAAYEPKKKRTDEEVLAWMCIK